MDNNNWRPIQGGEPAMDTSDWRTQLQPESRQRIINKIMDMLKKHLPYSGPEGLLELKKIAVMFEEKITDTIQTDYLRKICLTMLSMETESQNTMANSLPSNSVVTSNRIPRSRMDTLKKYPPFSGPEGLLELEKIVVRFEENIYTTATSQSDYLRKISLRMLSMETESQNTMANSFLFVELDMMGNNNWRPIQGGEPVMDTSDWRTQLQPESRQRIVNKIMDTLKKYLAFSGPEGLLELEKIAVRFEENIYATATSQTDYLRKISLKMLSMETKSQNTMANSLPSNSVVTSNRTPRSSYFVELDLMGNNNWRPIQGGEPTMDTSDWRTQLQPESRQRIVNKIMDMLKKHLPFSGPEGLLQLEKIAVRFEENIYATATSQSDYLRKISLKMLSMETKSQNTMANSLPSNSVVTRNRTPRSR